MKAKACLIVFAKYPIPGQVKTRLAKVISEEEAAAFFAASLLDSLDNYLTIESIDVQLYMAGSDEHDFAKEIPMGVQLKVQKGDGLGERMMQAFQEVFDQGYSRACIIGTDHPTLEMETIEKAFQMLGSDKDIVIGPSEDGGFYLLGLKRPMPILFNDMSYSHGKVFEETISRAREYSGLSLEALPLWYDVDEAVDLKRLSEDLRQSSNELARVRKVINSLIESKKYESLFGGS